MDLRSLQSRRDRRRPAGLALVVVVLAVGLLASACSSDFLRSDTHYQDEKGFTIDEDAKIEDTVEHREVIDVLLKYRNAIVNKDFGTLKRLVAPDYYDNGGTTDTTTDDYGPDKLDALYELMAKHAKNIRYDIVVKDVGVDGDHAHVDYEYKYAYQYTVGDEVSWDAGVEVNRLQLEHQGADWKIVSGL